MKNEELDPEWLRKLSEKEMARESGMYKGRFYAGLWISDELLKRLIPSCK
jgi:hypothetical protein